MSRYGLSIIIFLLVAGGVSSTLLASIKHQSTRKQLGQQAEDLRSGTASAAAASTRPPDEQAAESASAGKVAVIYYGWLIDESGQPNASARRLAAGKPDMIIAAAYTDNPRRSNLPPGVRALFNESHTRIAAYIATDYGRRPLPDVQAEIADVAAKVDGIFLDEVVASFDPQTWAYSLRLTSASWISRISSCLSISGFNSRATAVGVPRIRPIGLWVSPVTSRGQHKNLDTRSMHGRPSWIPGVPGG
jgi:hypothetical protein